MVGAYGGPLKSAGAKMVKALNNSAKTNQAISHGLSTIKKQTGLSVADAIQIWMAYNGVKQAYLAVGKSEEEAENKATIAAVALTGGKLARGFGEQHVARWLSKSNKTAQFSFLKKSLVEFGIPAVAFNVGKLDEAVCRRCRNG